MKVYLIIGLILVWIWILYEGWRAPGMEEDEYGNWKVVKPSKTLKDLFKKKEIKVMIKLFFFIFIPFNLLKLANTYSLKRMIMFQIC